MNPNDNRHHNLYEDPLRVLLPFYNMVIFLLMFPSNSVIVFLRKNMGYRLLRPWILGTVFLLLLLLSNLGRAFSAGDSSNAPTYAVLAFAVLMGVLAWIHRSRAWELVFRNSDPVHTMSRGDSLLTEPLGKLPKFSLPFFSFTTWEFQKRQVLPLPEWVIQRYIEPLVLMLLGVFFAGKLQWTILGGWLFMAGVSLAAIEALVIDQSISTFLDAKDDPIVAKFMRGMTTALPENGQEPSTKIGGLVTASPEMMRLRAQRLAAEPNAAPANPATQARSRVKAAASEEAAEAVSAGREATAAPARETIIIATERTMREVVIVQPEYTTKRVVIPGPLPEGMSAQEWFLSYSVYPDRFSFTPEQQAAILAAYDERQITGDTTPIVVQPAPSEPEETGERSAPVSTPQFHAPPDVEAHLNTAV